MDKIETIINYASYIILGISIVVTCLNLIISLIKKSATSNLKNSVNDLVNKQEQTIDDLEQTKSEYENNKGLLELILEKLPEAMKIAESENVSGATKKIIALSQIIQECSANGFDYQKNAQIINDALEEFIDISKNINVR